MPRLKLTMTTRMDHLGPILVKWAKDINTWMDEFEKVLADNRLTTDLPPAELRDC